MYYVAFMQCAYTDMTAPVSVSHAPFLGLSCGAWPPVLTAPGTPWVA